jgi:threonine dehydrogenase-like Zn-dependent dehydrogenase
MKAVVFDGKGSVKVTDMPKPDLQESKDALVRITHSSICGSDLNILRGKIVLEENGIMGHEGVGVVEEVGPGVTRIKAGDKVVISYSVQCGECESCRNGWVVFCERGGMLGHGKQWGGFGGTQAEWLRVPYADANLQPIPPNLTEEQVLFVSDILSTGYQACEYGGIRPGDFVVIFGAGPVGLCTVAAAKLFGPRKVVSVDLADYRLAAATRLGADAVLNPGKMNVVEEIKKMTNGKGAEVTIEAVGSSQTFDWCFESVRRGGTISIVGVFPSDKVGVSLRDMLRWNIQMRAGRANVVHMERLVSLIEGGKLDLRSLITHRMSLDEAPKAYEMFAARSQDVIKIILTP